MMGLLLRPGLRFLLPSYFYAYVALEYAFQAWTYLRRLCRSRGESWSAVEFTPPPLGTMLPSGVIHGLGNAQAVSFKFENYISKRLPRKILDRETLISEFGRLCFLDYVFILRLPSEALPAIRESHSADLLNRTPLPSDVQALIGSRVLPDGSGRIVLKIKTRKETRGAAILMRPCFCDGGDFWGYGHLPGSLFLAGSLARLHLWGAASPLYSISEYRPHS